MTALQRASAPTPSVDPAVGTAGRGPDEVSVVGLLNVLLAERRLLATMSLVGLALLVGIGVLATRQYASSAVFMPQSRQAPSNLGGLATQLGISIPMGEPGTSQQFYIDLIQSKPVLHDVVDSRYAVATASGSRSVTLAELYGGTESNALLRREAAVKKLMRDVQAKGRSTGVVDLTVKAADSVLAQQIAHRFLQSINQFNLERRQSQAAAERRFAEQRLAEVRGQLQRAEYALQSFLQTNRQYQDSPALSFARDRLAREISTHQQVYNSLTQSYEQAKLDEVRDIPVITVIAPPDVPLRPEPRGLAKLGLIGLFLGLSLGIVIAFLRQFLTSASRGQDDEHAEFRALKRQAVDDLRRPWRFFSRRPADR